MQLSQITILDEWLVQAKNGSFRELILVKGYIWCRKLHTFALMLHILNQNLDLLYMDKKANEKNSKIATL